MDAQLSLMSLFIISLSWCDTTASIFGRLYGSRTSRLPQSLSLPFTRLRIPLPFARRKSIAGFVGAVVTGSLLAAGFWGLLAPIDELLPASARLIPSYMKVCAASIVTGLVAGVSEAIGVCQILTQQSFC